MLKSEGALDRTFHALADPTRRAIVRRLARGEASVSEVARPFAMSLPAIHQHLALLHDAGLVTSRKEGRVRTCRLEAAALAEAETWLRGRREVWERKLDALAHYLDGDDRRR